MARRLFGESAAFGNKLAREALKEVDNKIQLRECTSMYQETQLKTPLMPDSNGVSDTDDLLSKALDL